jgi:hypothetical protein
MVDIEHPCGSGSAYHLRQKRLVLEERSAPQVAAVQEQEIECEVGESGLVAAVDGCLEIIEVSNPALVRWGNLAIERKLAAEFSERPEDRFELLSALVPIPGQQTDIATGAHVWFTE